MAKKIKTATILAKEIRQVNKLIRQAGRIHDLESENKFRELRELLRTKQVRYLR